MIRRRPSAGYCGSEREGMELFLFSVSFCASAVGSICGIGGGVIIKPVLDAAQAADVVLASFLSGCTVLSMSAYSVGKSLAAGDSRVDFRTGTPLGIGAAAGGLLGKGLFAFLGEAVGNAAFVGACQSLSLAVITVLTMLYTLCRAKIASRRLRSPASCAAVGMALGIFSSFLGVGGGPVNLAALYYFFSMSAKAAAQNSLYIILFSQLASLGATVLGGRVPDFEARWVVLMVLGGIAGGMAGHRISARMDDRRTGRLFVGLLAVIAAISLYNFLILQAELRGAA